MLKLAVRLVFALALAGFSTTALVGTAFADDKKEEKADKGSKKKKEKKEQSKDEGKSGW